MPTGEHLTGRQVAQIRELRADGMTAPAVGEIMGVSRQCVLRWAPGRGGKVPVMAVRQAFLQSGRTPSEVCRALGWECRNSSGVRADTSRLNRTLGLAPDCGRRRELVSVEMVERLADAIGVAAWEVLP